MKVIDKAAEGIAKRMVDMGSDREAALDPTTIMLIADIIFELLDRCRERRDRDSMYSTMREPGLLAKIAVRRAVRRELGRHAYRLHGREMVQSILKEGKNVTRDDVDALYNELEE